MRALPALRLGVFGRGRLARLCVRGRGRFGGPRRSGGGWRHGLGGRGGRAVGVRPVAVRRRRGRGGFGLGGGGAGKRKRRNGRHGGGQTHLGTPFRPKRKRPLLSVLF